MERYEKGKGNFFYIKQVRLHDFKKFQSIHVTFTPRLFSHFVDPKI